MNEVTKTILTLLIGAAGGFLAGISTEPFKIWFRNRNDRKRHRTLIYRDLAKIYEDMIAQKYLAHKGEEFSDENLRVFSDRRDAAKCNPVVYHELPEAADFDNLHNQLGEIAAQPSANLSHRIQKVDEMIAAFEAAIRRGPFKIRRLKKKNQRI